jgi:hypothetical protein
MAQLHAFCETASPKAQQDFPLKVLNWYSPGQNRANDDESLTVKDLKKDIQTPLRVVFAPLDDYRPETASDLLELLDVNEIPSGFVTERANSVPFSFGHRSASSSAHVTWFHYLCKDIQPQKSEHTLKAHNIHVRGRKLSKIIPLVNIHALQKRKASPQDITPIEQSSADYSWISRAFALRVVSETTSASVSPTPIITLICFGTFKQLEARFQKLLNDKHRRWEQALSAPYTLFSVVLDELYKEMDKIVWSLGDLFSAIEKVSISQRSGVSIAY